MRSLKFFLKYLAYLIRSSNAHGIHSPFVFGLYNQVIRSSGSYYIFDRIEQMRRKLLATSRTIEVRDFGTGKSGPRRISDIAQRSLKSRKYSQLLFRLILHFESKNILELGTSLGISTAYLASALKTSHVTTIEGCPQTAGEAEKVFTELKLENIRILCANLDDVLTRNPFPAGTPLDLVFFDGNHRKIPTLNYFERCLSHSHDGSVFIFDDIHWSGEMEEAWKTIQAHPRVTVTIDLHFMGLVFFRPEQAKQHFRLRY